MLSGCKNAPKQPSADFAGIVKAYTGRAITEGGKVRVEFTIPARGTVTGEALPSGTVSFSPKIAGQAVWTSPSGIEFVPESGSLKSGQTYTCSVNLQKLLGLKDPSMATFSFPVRVAEKLASVEIDRMVIPASDPVSATVEGIITLSQAADEQTVKALLPGATVTPASSADKWNYSIAGIKRDGGDSEYTVKLKDAGGFSAVGQTSITIPGINGDFRAMATNIDESGSPFIDIMFSDPLKTGGLASGEYSISGVGRAWREVSDNIMTIHFDRRTADEIVVNLHDIIRSADGRKIVSGYTARFASDRALPSVEILANGNILPDDKNLILPFRATGLYAVDLSVIKIYESNVLQFLQENSLSGDDGLRRSGRKILSKTIQLDGGPDYSLPHDYSVDLSGLFRQESGAIYRIRLSFKKEYSIWNGTGKASDMEYLAESGYGDDTWDYPSPWYYENFYNWEKYEWKDRDNPATDSYYMVESRFPVINLLASNIGLIAKYADSGKLWVNTNDIVSAAPMGGAEISVYNYQLQNIGSGKTSGEGMATIDLSGKPFIVTAKKGGSTAYLKVGEGFQKSLSRFDTGGKRIERGLKGYVYGERGVWRPGDTLHVTLLLGDKEKRVPEGHPATLELYGPEGQFRCKQICPGGTDGFYPFTIPTYQDDPTGLWNAYIKVGGATFHKALRIETVKPNRLKVETSLGGNLLKGGERTPVSVNSRWLTGPAASGLQASVSMTLSGRATSFKGFEGYVFNNPTATFTSSEHSLWSGRLDSDGKASAIVTLPSAGDAPGMLNAIVYSSVMEEGGDESFITEAYRYSPFKAYVGVKAPGDDLETDKDNIFKVAVVSPEGERVAGHRLQYKVFKLNWSWWWENNADELGAYVNGNGSEVWDSGIITSGKQDSEIKVRVDYPEWGRFLVYVKDLDSGHVSGMVSFIDWPAYRGRADRRDPDAITMLSFSTDKKSYEAGETATVYIPAAKNGKALVSLENASGVISRKWVDTSADGDTPFKFKVTGDMAPNFYVHVTLLQPHDNTANDLPIRMYGVQPVLVSDKASRLEPVIDMASTVHPEEEFTVKVSEKSGKPMTYTLAIVDEGLLDITSFKTPDPWNSMYAREALGVSTFDLYDEVIGAFSGKFSPMLGIGGDEDMITGTRRDNRFNAVVKYLGPFTVKKGSQTHKVRLPMYVGSVRVMVVAGNSEGAYGNADKSVAVVSPLMVVPTLPRVISTNEQVTLPVNVFALEEGVKDAKVSVKVEGPLSISGASEASVSFAKPGDEMVRFALKAGGEGFAKVTVSAQGSGHRTAETINIEVRNPAPYVTARQKVAIERGKSANLSWTASGSDASVSLEIASFPAIDFTSALKFVRSYPYNCTEQLSTRGIVLTHTMGLVSEEDAEKSKAAIPVVLQDLYARQGADGGFVYWPGMTAADTWVTSMAGIFLVKAKALGFDVSSSVINQWASFQKKAVTNWRKSSSENLSDLDQAFRLYSLAIAGKADAASMNRLKESAELTLQARLMLASAYAVTGKQKVAQELLEGRNMEFAQYDNDRISYGSSTRDKAMATETMALLGNIPAALDLSAELAEVFGRGWYSTQEMAFAALAMSRLAGAVNNAALDCTIDGKAVKSAQPVYTAALNPAAGKTDVSNSSAGTVYASLITVSRPEGPVSAAAEGLRLKVSYVDMDGKEVNPASLQQGSEITAVITVTNTSLARSLGNMALVQLIPSGWEIRNDRLTGASVNSSAYTYRDIRDDRNIWYFDLPAGTAKTFKTSLRAAYEGTFVLPSVSCEAMYDPHVYAHTASGSASVSR